jgi:hypothetical protein
MATLICYDIPSQHTAFKKKLLSIGYTDNITGTSICYLPNTTLSHANRAIEQARQDARTAASSLGISLEHFIAVSYDNWGGITGQPHS